MSEVVGLTRGGTEWTPQFITALDDSDCIGCGRCYKVCPRDVFELSERAAGDEELDDDDDDMYGDDDDGFDDDVAMVMSLKDAMDCIGCQACYRVCPKGCMSHETITA